MNEYFKNTTPAQRAKHRAIRKGLANQGYFAWGKAPIGLDKLKNADTGYLPLLSVNQTGLAIGHIFYAIEAGELTSYEEAQEYLNRYLGENGNQHPPLTREQMRKVLHDPRYMGVRRNQGEQMDLQFHKCKPPVPAERFKVVQVILARWDWQ